MKITRIGSNVFLLLASLLTIGGVFVDALEYDYTASNDCLLDPLKPQYNGGIIVNPEMNDGLKGWTTHGGLKDEARTSPITGNKYLLAHSRKIPDADISYEVFLYDDKLYTFSAWIQISGNNKASVSAVFKTKDGLKYAGSVVARVGCWSMLKGGLTVNSSTPSELYFQSDDTTVDIYVDSMSLQPFTKDEWRSHQDQSVEKVRRSNVRLQLTDANGQPIANTNITLQPNSLTFNIGASINSAILTNPAYQNWFLQRFSVATFENEMKWYSTENTPGKEDYSVPDAMLAFTRKYGILVRGHNIFWDDPQYQPWWVKNLRTDILALACGRRLNSVVSRYAGKVIAWDVNNENLHFHFFESNLGSEITNTFFKKTNDIDPKAVLFMNEYNTIEQSEDPVSSPSNYVQKLREIQSALGGKVVGIGLEGHFGQPDLAYVRSALDTLFATKMPLWITELDVQPGPNQATYYEQILRELHAHPSLQGIVMWGGWSPNGQCYNMCLVDANFKNLPAGDVLDKLIKEWRGGQPTGVSFGVTDENGYFNTSLLHGEYEVKFLQQKDSLEAEGSVESSHKFTVDHQSSKQPIKFVSQM